MRRSRRHPARTHHSGSRPGVRETRSQTLEALAGFRRDARVSALAGPSRKSFLVALGDVGGDRIWAPRPWRPLSFGAHVVRVHDVREMVQVVRVTDSIVSHASEFCSPLQ
jgi:dihydropteroate synthase